MAEALEIEHLLDRRPRQLSGGQRQRVALARAIVREPAAFLMDEPLSNLDAKLRPTMRGEIKRLQTRLGTTTLYVTHDQAEAMTMADLVAVMRDGELQQLGSARRDLRPAGEPLRRDLRRQPADERARGRARRRRPVPRASATRGSRSRRRVGRACAAAGASEIGMRPEDLESSPTPATLERSRGEIYVVEPMGNETLVDVRVGDQRLMVRAPRAFTAPIGSPIGVRVCPESACFFGRRRDGAPPERTVQRAKGDGGMTRIDTARQHAPAGAALSRRALLQASLAGGAARGRAALRRPARLGVAAVRGRRQGQARDRRLRRRRRSRRSSRRSSRWPSSRRASRSSSSRTSTASFFEKWFQDAQSKAGQYDIYIWTTRGSRSSAPPGCSRTSAPPASTATPDFAKPFIDIGYWPPRQGPRVKGFENATPTLIALPSIGDLQTLTYRNDVYTTAPEDLGRARHRSGKAAMEAGKIKYPIVFRGVKGNPIVTRWYPIFLSFGGEFFDDKWNVTFNSAAGQGGGRVLRRHAEVERPARRRRVRLRPGGRGDPRRRRRRDHPVHRQRHQVGRPEAVQGGRQARLRASCRRR